MKITLNLSQEEINAAISQYVATQGLNIEDKAVSIEMISGRKGRGNYATIELTDRVPTNGLKSDEDKYEEGQESIIAEVEGSDSHKTEEPEPPLADTAEPAAVANSEEKGGDEPEENIFN